MGLWAVAGFATPSNLAVMWSDGGGLTPDRVGIVYADPEVPVSRPRPCPVGGPCATIGTSTVLSVDPFTLSPQPPDFSQAYQDGMVLFAIQGPNGDPACDAVAPGLVATNMTAPMLDIDALTAPLIARTPLGRIGEPDDVAPGFLFLASPAARFVTGHTLVVDGGFSVQG